jgi:hypothetical protein
MTEPSNESEIKWVDIDLAERSLHLYAVDGQGREVLSRKLPRARLSAVVAQACKLAAIPYRRYRDSDNLVARLNLPNMRYDRAERVDV